MTEDSVTQEGNKNDFWNEKNKKIKKSFSKLFSQFHTEACDNGKTAWEPEKNNKLPKEKAEIRKGIICEMSW